jgi:hypothetical protein
METYGYILKWAKGEFKDAVFYECLDIPGVYTWAEKGSLYIRIGEKLFQKQGKDSVDFKCVEEFIISKCEGILKLWNERKGAKKKEDDVDGARKALLKELEELNLLISCMFK